SQTAREIHNQVRAWNYAFGMGPVDGPFAELDGKRLKVKQTSLTDRGDGSPAGRTAGRTIRLPPTRDQGRRHSGGTRSGVFGPGSDGFVASCSCIIDRALLLERPRLTPICTPLWKP